MSINGIRVTSNNIIIHFGVEVIKIAKKRLNKSQACDCKRLHLYTILYAHPATCTPIKKLFNVMLQFSTLPKAFEHNVNRYSCF